MYDSTNDAKGVNVVGTTDTEIPEKIKSKYGIIESKSVGSHHDGERGEVFEYIVIRERETKTHPYVVHTMMMHRKTIQDSTKWQVAFHWGDYCEDLSEARSRFHERR